MKGMSRKVFANLLREVPEDTIVFKATSGIFTAKDMIKEVEDGTEFGHQYGSDVLRIARDLLARQAQKKSKLVCGICGSVYKTAEAAEKCEKKPVLHEKKVSIGDTVEIIAGVGKGKTAQVKGVGICNNANMKYWHTQYVEAVIINGSAERKLYWDWFKVKTGGKKFQGRVEYKTPQKDTKSECYECGKFCEKNLVEVGFYHPNEGTTVGLFGSCCAKKYKVGEGDKNQW